MSDAALEAFSSAQQEQSVLNDARRIRTKVDEARKSPLEAAGRWPFEMLQNALDTGPRDGAGFVNLGFRQDGSSLHFEHDGAPFTAQDLAALVSGGSNKEFESIETTGRFGTGFLVTHVLSPRTRVRGIFDQKEGPEQFELMIDRSGDEDDIIANIQQCKSSIKSAKPIPGLDGISSAEFEYQAQDPTSFNKGLASLRDALPYLYGTRPLLGEVRVSSDEIGNENWSPGEVEEFEFLGSRVQERVIAVYQEGGEIAREVHCVRVMPGADSKSSVVIVGERVGDGISLQVPSLSFPRIFREYPIRGTAFLPVNFIIDGKLDVDQERSRILLDDDSKPLLHQALKSAAIAVQYVFERKWRSCEMLCRVAKISSDHDVQEEYRSWWNNELAALAGELATLPLVETHGGFVPGIVSDDRIVADFLLARSMKVSRSDETAQERIWSLASQVDGINPPILSVAEVWSKTSASWAGLGVQICQVTLEDIADRLKTEAKEVDELPVNGDRYAFLAEFFDVLGECWKARTGVEKTMLDGLVPDQNGRLSSPDRLSQDAGVPEELKDISEIIGLDIRSQLLHSSIREKAEGCGLKYLDKMLAQTLPGTISENKHIEDCIKHLQECAEDDKEVDELDSGFVPGSIALLAYLYKTNPEEAEPLARGIPLVSAEGKVIRWTKTQQMMAPVKSWHPDARQFSGAYPQSRILSPDYHGEGQNGGQVIEALCAWRMALADPLDWNMPKELKEPRLAAIAEDGQDTEGVSVSGERFRQIALLQPEVLNRCSERQSGAKALLGLVLCYIAPNDSSWKEWREVVGRRAREDVPIRVHGALWLGDLRYRAWIPMESEEGQTTKVMASANSLKDLLEPEWLHKNEAAIELLSREFGFDSLDLRLLGVSKDETTLSAVRNGLARLVEVVGADAEEYSRVVDAIEEGKRRQRDVDHCRRLGLAVQDAVRSALESHPSVNLELVDRGFDYEVSAAEGYPLEDASYLFQVGSFLLEVKATTSGEARLTPKQAETAANEPNRFALCVVDLRKMDLSSHGEEWTATEIEPLSRIIDDVGSTVSTTHDLVEQARTGEVRIRNEKALRYAVPGNVWENGCTISEWVAKIIAG